MLGFLLSQCAICVPIQGLCSHQREFHSVGCKSPCSLFFCGIIQKGFPVEKTHFFFPFLLSQSYLPREAACMDLQFCLQEIGTLFHIKFMAAVRRVWDFHPTHCSTQCFVPPQFNCFLSFLSCIQSQTGFSGWDYICTCPSPKIGGVNQAVNNLNFLMGTKK